LEKDFTEFARKRARDLAPGLDWEKPPADRPLASADWVKAHPTNFWSLRQEAQQLVEAKKWAEAKAPLGRLLELYPAQTGRGCAYELMAAAHRSLGETNDEHRVLTKLAEQDDEATEAYLRLMELGVASGDWAEVRANAERFLAVNPLVAPPYRQLARAGEGGGDEPRAIAAYRTLLHLDPPNPADVHFRLARLLDHAGDPTARRHTLMALEEAPRHRAALQLLLKLNRASPGPAARPVEASEVPK
jgi:tetratricopeptide (TPR) repeat protein